MCLAQVDLLGTQVKSVATLIDIPYFSFENSTEYLPENDKNFMSVRDPTLAYVLNIKL